jgi:hypothetical protein
MSLEAWQRALRRRFGREQRFRLKNTGDHPVFSEFEVTNPQSRATYRVVIRGSEPGHNVHRLGQMQPVQIVSFVAKGTIEEGMLSVLGFKRSLVAGVLDGGEREVFLGGSRLTRFMESVETVTAGIQAPIAEEAAEPAAAEPGAAEDSVDDDSDVAVAAASPRPVADPLGNLLRTGLELLTQFAAAGTSQPGAGATPSRLFERIRDERSGHSYLKIRMPEPEVVDRFAEALQGLLESLRR